MITTTKNNTASTSAMTHNEFDHLFSRMAAPGMGLAIGLLDHIGPRCMSSIQVQEHAEEVVVKTAVPGLKANELDIDIKDDVLIIKGQRAQQELDDCNAVNCCQVQGRFERLVHLPHSVERQFADAVVEDGVLTITLPKAQAAQTWSIEVRTA